VFGVAGHLSEMRRKTDSGDDRARAPQLLGAFALSVLVAGCASAAGLADRERVIRTIVPSAVQLRAEREAGIRRAGSGVVLASDATTGRSWVLTTRHFLDTAGPQQLFVSSPGRQGRLPASIAAVSSDVDLAVVEVKGVVLPPVRLKGVVHLGDEIWVVGFPWGRPLTMVSGVVSQVESEGNELAVEGAPRMIDATVSYGSSGAGVFDVESGALVGAVEGYRTARVAIRKGRSDPWTSRWAARPP
jgi:serine protease Do